MKLKNNRGKSKISRPARHSRVDGGQPVAGCGKEGEAAVSGFVPAASPTSAPSSASGYVLKKAGQVAQVTGGKSARRTRTRRVPVVMPKNILRAWVTIPALRDEIELQRRLVIVQAVAVMKKLGVSQNRAARELGIAGSKLSLWLSTFAAEGKEGLRPKPRRGGRRAASGSQARANAFLNISIR